MANAVRLETSELERPLLREIGEAQMLLRLGRTRIYELLAAGELESVKVGRRRLITSAALDRFVARLESAAR